MNNGPRTETEWKMLDELAIRQDTEKLIREFFFIGIAIVSLVAVLTLGELMNPEDTSIPPQKVKVWLPNEVDYFEWGFTTEQERWRRLKQLEGKP